MSKPTEPTDATKILQLNHLLDLLDEAAAYADTAQTDHMNMNIRGYIREAISVTTNQLGRISGRHIRYLHKKAGSPSV